jgi:hypothetical protein
MSCQKVLLLFFGTLLSLLQAGKANRVNEANSSETNQLSDELQRDTNRMDLGVLWVASIVSGSTEDILPRFRDFEAKKSKKIGNLEVRRITFLMLCHSCHLSRGSHRPGEGGK